MTANEYVGFEKEIEKRLESLPNEMVQKAKVEFGSYVFRTKNIQFGDKTEHLSSQEREDIFNKLDEQNITCIVIAHRLSTIRSCDKIVVMDNGCILDTGTHEQLLSRCSIYKDLVLSE